MASRGFVERMRQPLFNEGGRTPSHVRGDTAFCFSKFRMGASHGTFRRSAHSHEDVRQFAKDFNQEFCRHSERAAVVRKAYTHALYTYMLLRLKTTFDGGLYEAAERVRPPNVRAQNGMWIGVDLVSWPCKMLIDASQAECGLVGLAT